MSKYSDKVKETAVEMFEDGVKVEDICDVLGVSEYSVANWAKQAGVERKKINRRKEDPPIAAPEWVEWFQTEWNEVCRMIRACS